MIYSTIESEVFGLNVYRTVNLIENYSLDDLKKYIEKNKIDVIRVNSNKTQDEINAFFNNSNIPFQIVNQSYKYQTSLDNFNCTEFPDIKNITCKQVSTEAEKKIFLDKLLFPFRNDPIGFYRVNMLTKIISKEKELLALEKYLTKKYINKECFFSFLLDNGINYLCNTEEYNNDLVMNHMASVSDEYLNKGYFFKSVYFFMLYYKNKGFKMYEVGARGDNVYSQKVFLKLGFELVKSETIYYLCPLIKYKS